MKVRCMLANGKEKTKRNWKSFQLCKSGTAWHFFSTVKAFNSLEFTLQRLNQFKMESCKAKPSLTCKQHINSPKVSVSGLPAVLRA